MTVNSDSGRLLELMALANPSSDVQTAAAMEAAAEALALARRIGDAPAASFAGVWLARHCLHLGQFAKAMEHATEAARGAPPQAYAEALRVIAIAGSELGQFEQALAAAQEGMQLAPQLQDADAVLSASLAMAVCFERMGDSWQAMRLLSQSLAEHGRSGSERVLLSASNALCAICPRISYLLRDCDSEVERLEVLARGREAGELAMRLAERQSNAVFILVVQINLAEVLVAQGELSRATALLNPARDAARQKGLLFHAWLTDINLADVQVQEGLADAALESINALLSEMVGQAPAAAVSRAHEIAYRAAKTLGQFETALSHFEQSERLERASLTKQLRNQASLLVTRSEERSARHQASEARLDAQRQREAAARFAEDAARDPLTQLGNRRHLERRMAELLPQLMGEQRPVAVAQIDVDHFKSVNDKYGHAAGDAVLVTLSQCLVKNSRAADVLVRQGGEEFVMVLPDTPLKVAVEVCERLRAQTQAMAVELPDGRSLRITVSIGLSVSPPYELISLLQRADEALYAAKRAGRNRLCVAAAGEAS